MAHDLFALVPDPPAIMAPRINFQAPVGATVRLWLYVDGVPTPEVTWMHRKRKLSAAVPDDKFPRKRVELLIQDVKKKDFGRYKCVVFNALGTAHIELALLGTSLSGRLRPS